MTDNLKQILKEELGKLPKEAQDAINSFDWASMAEKIAGKYLLYEDVNDFQVETMLVLLGLEDIDSFARNIENQIGTSKEDAENMARETETTIFNPIYNKLEEIMKKNSKDKNANWEKSVDFILSGGNYSTLLDTPMGEEI